MMKLMRYERGYALGHRDRQQALHCSATKPLSGDRRHARHSSTAPAWEEVLVVVARILEKFVNQMNREAARSVICLWLPLTDWTLESCSFLVQKNGHRLRSFKFQAL